jgi:parvulin-like peptidyl-prolyl isomerase
MRYLLVFPVMMICLLLTTLALGQDEPAQSGVPPEYRPPILRDSDEQQALPASAAKLAPDAAIITVKGVCAQMPPSSAGAADASCQTVITKAQFEALADALLARMKDSRKRTLANAYPNLLAMAREAEARGVEKTPRFQERLAFARVQILSQELIRQIDEESAQVSEKDIADYYHDHAASFATATLERVFIPNRKRLDPLPAEKSSPENIKAQQEESESAMTQLADELRAKAAAGADFMTLQKQAYAAAGSSEVPPNPSVGRVQRASLPLAHASVFDLKPGEVSQVFSDSTGHYIYKVDSKNTKPLDAVKEDIRKTLTNQHSQEAIQAVQQPVTTEFNPAYFGPATKRGDAEDSKSK